jgi:hypothetical protein
MPVHDSKAKSGNLRVNTKSIGKVVKAAGGQKVWKQHKTTAAEWAKKGEWVRVKSSNVKAISYDYLKHIMKVRFKSNAEYHYYHCPVGLARSFFNSASMGRFVWKIRRMDLEFKRVK